jgi:hypothetical protein
VLYSLCSDMPLAAKVLSADLQLFVDPSIAVGFPNQGPTGSNDVRRGGASTESAALSAVVRYCIHSTNTALRCIALRCVALYCVALRCIMFACAQCAVLGLWLWLRCAVRENQTYHKNKTLRKGKHNNKNKRETRETVLSLSRP